MGQCFRQACFKFHLCKQSSHITISSLCFLNLTSCTATIAPILIMCCTEVCGLLVMSFLTIKSLYMDLLNNIFWVVCRYSVGTTVTSVIMCCTEVCSLLVTSFITQKSLHIDLLIHILGGMQMFCGRNCNYNICHYVLYRGLQTPGNVFYHNKVSSYGSTHSYMIGWYADILWAQHYVLYRGLRPPGNVFYHNKVSSHRSTHSYFLVV